MSKVNIRTANIHDCGTIRQFIFDLAIYEKAEHEVLANENHIRDTLFCDQPQAYALIAEINNNPIGFTVYFFSYSTWLGRRGIYLDDLYVSEEHRGQGAGKALLKSVAEIAVEKNCRRLEWSVLDWNIPSIKFYEAMGAKPKDGWTVYRLDSEALKSFAEN